MEQLKAALAVLAAFLGKRLFAWLAAACVAMGVAEPPMSESQITSFLGAMASLGMDAIIYAIRHQAKPKRKGKGKC